MTTNTIDTAEMSRDHERWETDHANWLRDVYRWQKQHESALNELERLEAIVTNFTDAVRRHADGIVAHEKTLVHNARVIRETRSADDLHDSPVTCHRHVTLAHAQTDDAHARLKTRHEDVMFQLRVLSRTVDRGVL